MPALWLPGNPKAQPPEEWGELQLCRLFHCLPDELDRQDSHKIAVFAEMLNIEDEVKRARKPGKKPRRRGSTFG